MRNVREKEHEILVKSNDSLKKYKAISLAGKLTADDNLHIKKDYDRLLDLSRSHGESLKRWAPSWYERMARLLLEWKVLLD